MSEGKWVGVVKKFLNSGLDDAGVSHSTSQDKAFKSVKSAIKKMGKQDTLKVEKRGDMVCLVRNPEKNSLESEEISKLGDNMTRKEKGQKYEKLVAELFESEGYGVERNAIREGNSGSRHEIDVLATHEAELHDTRIAIECKAHQKPIPKDPIMKLKEEIGDIGLDRGIFVSKSGFTKSAEAYGRKQDIELWGPEKLDSKRSSEGMQTASSEMSKKGKGEDKSNVQVVEVNNNYEEYGKKYRVKIFFEVKNEESFQVRSLRAKVRLLSKDGKVLDMKEKKLGRLFPNETEDYKVKLMPLKKEFKADDENEIRIRIKIFNKDSLFGEDIFRADHPTRGFCFIATAAYGSPLGEELELFRSFRDEVLLSTKIGKGLVQLYYRLSPPFAEKISRSDRFRSLVRKFMLNPIAERLRKNNGEG